MTEEQQQDLCRLRRYIEKQQLASVMNDTKWRELRQAMIEREHKPRFRLQCLLAPPTDPERWDGEWYYHLPTFVWIEWLDIDPIHRPSNHLSRKDWVDLTGELLLLLETHSIPFEMQSPFIRIHEYRRTGV